MNSRQLQKHHLRAFARLSLSERLSRSFSHYHFLSRFMNAAAREINKQIRKDGKKYFGS